MAWVTLGERDGLTIQVNTERRVTPRLVSTGRAFLCSVERLGNDDHPGMERRYGITDGRETVWFDTRTEAALAAKVHNLVNHQDVA